VELQEMELEELSQERAEAEDNNLLEVLFTTHLISP